MVPTALLTLILIVEKSAWRTGLCQLRRSRRSLMTGSSLVHQSRLSFIILWCCQYWKRFFLVTTVQSLRESQFYMSIVLTQYLLLSLIPFLHWYCIVKGKVFPYSLPSIGPGADPGIQAVSPQVTWSESRHRPGSRLLLLSARPAVTSVAFTRWRYL